MRTLVESGADVVEVGLPLQRPGDGRPGHPGRRQPRAGSTAYGSRDIFAAVRAVTEAGGVAVVMSYWNPILQYGVDRFAADLAAAGGAGVITPDLIPDEAGEWLAAADAHELDRIFLVAPSSTTARLAMTTAHCRGFVYVTSIMGVTGTRTQVGTAASDLVRRTRATTDLPLCVGLGVTHRCPGRGARRCRRRRDRRFRAGQDPGRRRTVGRPARRSADAGRGPCRRRPAGPRVTWSARGVLARWVGLAARLGLATVWIYAASTKLGKPLTSARAVQAYEIFPYDMAGLIGQALPVLEVAVGLLLLVGLFTRPIAVVSVLLLVVFIAGIASAWARGLSIDCGCFGGGGALAWDQQPEYGQEIARDVGFLALAGWLVVRPRSPLAVDNRFESGTAPNPVIATGAGTTP